MTGREPPEGALSAVDAPGAGRHDGREALLLLSGGIDSSTLLVELMQGGCNVTALTFDYGQCHRREVDAARRFCALHVVADHVVIGLDLHLGRASTLLGGGPPVAKYAGEVPGGPVDSYVPARNLVFLSHAAAVAEARGVGRVLVGFNADDAVNYWDCSREFVERINDLLRLSGRGAVQVEAPYLTMSKGEVVVRSRRLGVDLSALVSCYDPTDGAECGACLACRRRREAVRLADAERVEPVG